MQSVHPEEYVAVADRFRKAKMLLQWCGGVAKFLSKGRFMWCWGKVTRSYSLKTKFFVILSETKCVIILLCKTTFGGSTSLLFSVEEAHKSKIKAVSLCFFCVWQRYEMFRLCETRRFRKLKCKFLFNMI